MNKREYLEALAKLGLTIVGAGPVFGLSKRHAQRYAAGDTSIPGPLAKLVRVMLARRIAPEVIAEL